MAIDFVSPSDVSPTSYVAVQRTFQQLAEQAYRIARALKHSGQGLSPSEQQEAVDIANDMIDGWKIERLLVIFFIRTVVQIALNKSAYGVGPGQDWDIERPETLHAAGFVLNQGTPTEAELPMQVLLTYGQWASLVAKLVGGTIPLILYYRATLPYGTAQVWPVNSLAVPTASIALYTPGTLQEFQSYEDPAIMPKGFREMFIYNLATRVHERYPELMTNETEVERLYNRAQFYKERVKNQQVKPLLMNSDPASLGDHRGSRFFGMPKAWTPYD